MTRLFALVFILVPVATTAQLIPNDCRSSDYVIPTQCRAEADASMANDLIGFMRADLDPVYAAARMSAMNYWPFATFEVWHVMSASSVHGLGPGVIVTLVGPENYNGHLARPTHELRFYVGHPDYQYLVQLRESDLIRFVFSGGRACQPREESPSCWLRVESLLLAQH